jgi:hypothetical protein
MAATLTKAIPKSSAVAQAEVIDAPVLPNVNWRKDPGLRKLYFYAAIICVASATTGYDGYIHSLPEYMPSRLNDSFVQIYVEQHPNPASMERLLR